MLPYPVLTIALSLMWLLLNGFTLGHLILGVLVAVFASWALAFLRPEKPRLAKWYLLPKLFFIAFYDIIRSNIAVALILLKGKRSNHTPGFLLVPLEIQDRTALALLAIILTSTPGSAWLEYDSGEKTMLLHVLDLTDEAEWIDIVKNRYEKLLMEIFA